MEGKFIENSFEKPPFLYHATPHADIEVFRPRAEKVRDKNEGARIFATPSREVASMFLVPSDDSWANSGNFGKAWYFICSDKDRFTELDQGKYLYKLPSDSFTFDPHKGLGENEWTSSDEVKPVGSEKIESALEEMLKQGVQVYFVDEGTYKNFHGNETRAVLQGLVSENQKRGINVREL